MATKTKQRPKPRPRKPIATYEENGAAGNGEAGEVAIDADRLAAAKEWEEKTEDARLKAEEAKAEYGLARAQHKLLLAKRNRLIAKTEDCSAVDDAQRAVRNAGLEMAKMKSLATSAKDEWHGCQEQLARALTETHPLFDKKE